MPISHHRLLQQAESTLSGNGMFVVDDAHALTGEGNRYFALLEVRNGSTHSDYSLVVGLRNSHDMSFSAPLAIGHGTFVSCCSHGCTSDTLFVPRWVDTI